jgi:DNA invertase Pin-like site-specific DNA recombinase
MVASVLFGLAEIESEYRRERQAAGVVVAKERGVRYRAWRPDQEALPEPLLLDGSQCAEPPASCFNYALR